MPQLLTPKQIAAFQRGVSECHACDLLIQAREQMGLDTSAKQAENETIRKVIEAALALHERYKNAPPTG